MKHDDPAEAVVSSTVAIRPPNSAADRSSGARFSKVSTNGTRFPYVVGCFELVVQITLDLVSRRGPRSTHKPSKGTPVQKTTSQQFGAEPPRYALDDAPLSRFHKMLTLYSCGGPFLDGYILSIIGVAMVQITPQFGLSVTEQGLIGAAALIGIFLGAGLGGWLSDKLGRQVLFTLDLSAIIALSVAQFWVEGFVWLFVLRLLIGVAVGADYPIATSLLAEFTPSKSRGPLLGWLTTAWFVGAAVAYVVGEILLHTGPEGWKWMLASASVPALIIVLARLGTPESPRWLMSKGRIDEANEVVRQVHGGDATVADLPPAEKEDLNVMALIRSGYVGRMVFVSVFYTCSIIPLFAVYAFGPQVLQAFNMSNKSFENYGSAFITVLFLIGCTIACFIINRTGRRPLLIHSFAWSGVALLLLGIFPHASAGWIAFFFTVYAVTLGGTQILTWIYPSELFPTEIRATGIGIAASASRIGAAIGTFLVPVSLAELGIGPTMFIGAAITLIGCVVSFKWAPETAGLALHQSAKL